MRFLAALMLCLLTACSGDGNGNGQTDNGNRLLHPAEFYNVAILKDDEMKFLGSQLALLNDPDRGRQRQALERIGRFQLRGIPILLVGLERGHSSAQQGCVELLRALRHGSATLRSSGKKVPNRDILGAWYLRELEKGYKDLKGRLDIGTGSDDDKETKLMIRANYRQQLCTLYAEVADPKYTPRFTDAIVRDDNELVRAAAWSICAKIATSRDLPRLIEIYSDETPLARDYLWKTLKKLTGRNYPDDPAVWKIWLSRGSD